ncbi:MAG: ATP-binding protein [Dehalococcoidia bacterium]
MAIALGIAATEAGYHTYFTTAADLMAGLRSPPTGWQRQLQDAHLHRPLGLVLNELGYPLDADSGHWILAGRQPSLTC